MWGGGDLEKNPNLMKWVMVCLDKRDGGWGVRSFVMLNKALLGKWSWRFLMIETLWRKVDCGKFGEESGGWCLRDFRGAYGICIWKEIRKEWDTIYYEVVFSFGNGRRLRFWNDVWRGEGALCHSFPSLFALTTNKEALVADVWELQGRRRVGPLAFLDLSLIGKWKRFNVSFK